jgi:hypothetical protein
MGQGTEGKMIMDGLTRAQVDIVKDLMAVVEEQKVEIERLQVALEPFAAIGRKIAPAVGDTFPPGASARYLNLDPLVAQNFVDASKCLDGEDK